MNHRRYPNGSASDDGSGHNAGDQLHRDPSLDGGACCGCGFPSRRSGFCRRGSCPACRGSPALCRRALAET
ncbi:hypothetical protein, partial [uncultured Oscillibacter sp.]|uniref:hypothetical protein n=1 Tax=uncultured Oscillibacter sp. TaxID=876091 RepID=UPI0026372687